MLKLGCLVLVIAGGSAVWAYRAPIVRTASEWFGPHHTPLPAVTDSSVGAPTPQALARTQKKVERLKAPNPPDSVVLSANEIASMVGSGIDWSVRKSFDSLRVELFEGSLAVHCRLDTKVIPPDVLGPLASLLNPMEPLRIAGPLRIEKPGVARWTIQELSLRGMAFPSVMVTQLARRMAGADVDGAVPLRVSPDFQDVAIHPTGVVLYRTRRVAR
jgi:hypothetical protein